MAFKKLVQCPACRFTNRQGDARCLICKGPLPQAPAEAAPPSPPPDASSDRTQRRAPRPPGAAPGPSPAGGTTPIARQGPPGAPPRRPGPPPPGPPGRPAGPPPRRPPAKGPDVRVTATQQRPVLRDDAADEAAVAEAVEKLTPERPTTRIVAGSVDPSKILGWLCCDPLPPIPLGGKPLLTIGRHHDCDLVLPHKEVSRRHAVVKVRGTNIVYEDEGSSNGSFVNGQRVNHTLLRLGDVITVGPYEVELRSNDQMAGKDEKSETKTNLELTSVSRLSPLAAMTGKLQEVPLAEVLQGIEFNKKTGTLTIISDKQEGLLVVDEGEPVFARWGDLRDDDAVLRMLTLIKGRFAFVGDIEPGERTMRSSLTGLLLEASRRIDEGETAPSDQGAPASPIDLEPDGEP